MSDEEVIQKMIDHIISGLGSNFGVEQVYGYRIDKASRIRKLKKEKLEEFLNENVGVWCAIAIVKKIPERDATPLDQFFSDAKVPQTINIEKGDSNIEPPAYKVMTCTECGGWGMKEVGIAAMKEVCMACQGQGRREVARKIICDNCKGKGHVTQLNETSKCEYKNCNGSGWVKRW